MSIMKYWDIGEVGVSSYRRGFCVAKITQTYTSVWMTAMILRVFIAPALLMVESMRGYQKCKAFLRGLVGVEERNAQEQLDGRVSDSQMITADVLVSITVGIVLAPWCPLLLVVVCCMPPLLNSVYVLQHELDKQQLRSAIQAAREEKRKEERRNEAVEGAEAEEDAVCAAEETAVREAEEAEDAELLSLEVDQLNYEQFCENLGAAYDLLAAAV